MKKIKKEPYKNEYDYIRHKFMNELPNYSEVFLFKEGNRIYFTDELSTWSISTIKRNKYDSVVSIDFGLNERQTRFFQYNNQDIYKYRKSGTESKDELYDFEEYLKKINEKESDDFWES